MTNNPNHNGLAFDGSNARITELMCGRTVDRVYRKGKDLIVVFTDSMEVTLASDINHDIHYKNHETRVYIEGLGMGSALGKIGG